MYKSYSNKFFNLKDYFCEKLTLLNRTDIHACTLNHLIKKFFKTFVALYGHVAGTRAD